MTEKVRKLFKEICSVIVVIAMVITMVPSGSVSGATGSTTPAKAVFYVLGRSYSRPTGTSSQTSAKYTYAGSGTIKDTKAVSDDDLAVAENILVEPDTSAILNDGEKIVWYVIKKENDGWHVDGEIVKIDEIDTDTVTEETTTEAETTESTTETTTETVETTKAYFALLNRGYSRPTTTKSEAASKYTKVGKGEIYETVCIDNDDEAVKANIAVEPDLSAYLEEGETVVWYVVKKESDGWHVDGEIVSKSAETTPEITTQETTTQETTTAENVTTESVTEETTTEEVTTEKETEKQTEEVTEPSTEAETEETTTEAASLTTARFALLNRGYDRPTTTKSESTSKYTNVGKGKIYEEIKIDNDDSAVKANIAVEPDLSSYLEDGEKVVWYVVKKESDGWHVDGEIISTSGETTTEEKTTEETTTKETEAETEKETEETTTENETEANTSTDSAYKALRAEIKAMILTGDSSVHDISSYKYKFSQVDEIWNDLAENECYVAVHTYGGGFLANNTDSNGYITSIYIYNCDSDFPNRYQRTLEAIDEAMSGIDSRMSDLEKLIHMHDYVVEHTTYKSSGGYLKYCAGSVLGDGNGVCQGYADALKVLLHEVGIKSYSISSSSMNHGWLYVNIDGEYYHVDPTWADTCTEISGEVSHTFFLRNDTEYSTTMSKKHTNWYCSAISEASSSTKYTDWYVHGVVGRMFYQNKLWYYYDRNTNSIKKAKIDGSSMSVVIDGSNSSATLKIVSLEDGVLTYKIGTSTYTVNVK